MLILHETIMALIVSMFSSGISLGGTYWNKFGTGSVICNSQNNKLLSLLNLLCNTTQTTSVTTRDACYGCFFRAGSLPGGQTQLTSLNQCASLYLTNTDYSQCATELALVANGSRPTTAPTTAACFTGYCDFVRCVRRLNANRLINQCFVDNVINRNFTIRADRIFFYTNMTSCILARTRCSLYNPISGEIQNQLPYDIGVGAFGAAGLFTQASVSSPYLYNSLQITPNGDIRIITFPATVGVADLFCSRITTLEQSSYMDSIC